MPYTAHTYNLGLVALSYVVATIASYTALELARRVTKSEGHARHLWLGAGAVAMGLGIWSMHFIGMLAYDPHMPVAYDVPITTLSWVVAVLVSGYALFIGSRGKVNTKRWITSGVLMGAGISAMHYTGMAAMRMAAELRYYPGLLALSIAIAMVVSSVALWLFFMFSGREEGARFRYKAAAALVMGLAICGMHYTGMEAAYYVGDPGLTHAVSDPRSNLWLATSVGFATLFILGVTLLIVFFDQKLSVQQALGKYLERIVEERTAELYLEKERAEVTLDSIADAVITTDAQGNVQRLNPVAEQLTGWRMQDVKGKPLTAVYRAINEATRAPADEITAAALRAGKPVNGSGCTVLQARDGREFAVDESAAPIYDHDDRVIGSVLVFRDVSAKREMARQLSHQASHDALTGLPNRANFESRLQQAIESARKNSQQHAFLYLDLDRFKFVNDTCGHAAGDELLRQVSELFRAAVRESDIAARLGGDEFGVLLLHCPLPVAKKIAEKIRKRVEEFRFLWGGRSFSVGVSIGLIAIHAGSGDTTRVLSAADRACYLAKEQGRNNVQIYQDNDKECTKRNTETACAERIREALAQDRFVLYRQRIEPLERQARGEHFEVLLRLRDSHGKLLAPAAFVPAAERYGLMPAIDRWVVHNVLLSLARDPALRATVQMCAINLSGQSLGEENFLKFVEEQLDESRIEPGLLCFEVTETAIISSLEKAAKFIKALRRRGCRFALDDFGSGVSSFAYLKSLPVDYLKIGGSFISGMLEHELDGAIVRAIRDIGRVMGVQIIAEFVETRQVVEQLKILGVDYAQGYGIEKPRPLVSTAPAELAPLRSVKAGGAGKASELAAEAADKLNGAREQ